MLRFSTGLSEMFKVLVNMGLDKVIRRYQTETINICTTFMATHSVIVEIFYSGPNWWTNHLTNIPTLKPCQ